MNKAVSRDRALYFFVSLLLMLLLNRIIFPLAHLLSAGAPHHDFHLPADDLIPFLPWMIVVYIGVFAWWVYVTWLITGRERPEADRFFFAHLLTYLISFLFFVFLPTEIVRPKLSGNSIWIVFLQLLYQSDTPDNLFPSIHCALGWLCWIGIRGKKDIPFWIRSADFLLAAAVCVSTLTIRQHVLLDVFAGILLSEICYLLSGSLALRKRYSVFIDRMMMQIAYIWKNCPDK